MNHRFASSSGPKWNRNFPTTPLRLLSHNGDQSAVVASEVRSTPSPMSLSLLMPRTAAFTWKVILTIFLTSSPLEKILLELRDSVNIIICNRSISDKKWNYPTVTRVIANRRRMMSPQWDTTEEGCSKQKVGHIKRWRQLTRYLKWNDIKWKFDMGKSNKLYSST